MSNAGIPASTPLLSAKAGRLFLFTVSFRDSDEAHAVPYIRSSTTTTTTTWDIGSNRELFQLMQKTPNNPPKHKGPLICAIGIH